MPASSSPTKHVCSMRIVRPSFRASLHPSSSWVGLAWSGLGWACFVTSVEAALSRSSIKKYRQCVSMAGGESRASGHAERCRGSEAFHSYLQSVRMARGYVSPGFQDMRRGSGAPKLSVLPSVRVHGPRLAPGLRTCGEVAMLRSVLSYLQSMSMAQG